MERFTSDGAYEQELTELSQATFGSMGVSSPMARREIMYLADGGNTVAMSILADMIFYNEVPAPGGLSGAFEMYMKSAGITVENSEWKCSGRSYPPAFWHVGYYLVNYKRESVLSDCETIDIIEEMSKFKRLALALELAVSCLKYVNVPAAYNLAGRILEKAGHEREVFEAVSGVIKECVSGKSLEGLGDVGECSGVNDCLELARLFFKAASDKGYVYACNNMAVAVAEKIVWGDRNDKENVDRYAEYLRLAADRYEPYAANRLGLFYACGEVRCSDGAVNLREYVDMPKAKEYFLKATRYPDANSAWAYFNLIKYFHKDYIKDIDLLGKHMDEIKRLNPEVYDLAMEL